MIPNPKVWCVHPIYGIEDYLRNAKYTRSPFYAMKNHFVFLYEIRVGGGVKIS